MFKRINVPDEPRCANFKKIWTELGNYAIFFTY